MKNPFSGLFGQKATQAKDIPETENAKSAQLSPDGLRVTNFPPQIATLLRMYGMGSTHGAIYASQPNVRTAVQTIAREAAELSLKLYEKDPRGKLKPDARIEAGDHPMMHLLDEPTPGKSNFHFWFSTFADIGIYDLALWEKIRVGGGPPQALIRVPPSQLLPVLDPLTGMVTHWRTARGQIVRNENLVVFWGYDPQVTEGNVSPLETLRRLLSEEQAAGADREGMWRNSARKDGVIEQAAEATRMGDDARESFLLDVEDSLTGPARSGRPLMLEPGMKWNDTQWSPRETEYLNARKLNRIEVAAAYHIPTAMLAANELGNEPDEKTLEFFYTSTLPPYLSRVESDIKAQLLPEFELSASSRRAFYIEFNLDAKLRGSFEKQAAIMATTAGGPVITVNEGRARLNLPPLPGGDALLSPLNSIRGGGPQASPQNPVDTPAEGNNPAGTTPGGGTAPPADKPAAAEAKPPKSMDDITEMLGKTKTHDEHIKALKAQSAQLAFLSASRVKFSAIASTVMAKYYRRQGDALRGGREMNHERWDKELANELFSVYYQVISSVGPGATKWVDNLEFVFDPERTASFLRSRAMKTATDINNSTERRLAEVKSDEPGSEEVVNNIFGENRAEKSGTDIGTWGVGWSMYELTRQYNWEQSGKLAKTWSTTSDAPRESHAKLDGNTVGWDAKFANGLLYPGDSESGSDENANCSCVITVQVTQ